MPDEYYNDFDMNDIPVDPESYNNMGQTALHIAALWNQLEAAQLLIDAGASTNNRNSSRLGGCTPLFMAAQRNHADMVNLLVRNGAIPQMRNLEDRFAYEYTSSKEIW